jgi:hypothetical protein
MIKGDDNGEKEDRQYRPQGEGGRQVKYGLIWQG